MRQGAELIAAERERQISEEGWNAAHDDLHEAGELGRAAACYALYACGQADDARWPWEGNSFKPTDPIGTLVKAGALIAAEIDRRLRQETGT